MPTVIKVPDLLQLALVPQNVNFNALHVALQAIVYHLDLSEMKIQFNGNDSYEIQNLVYDSSLEEIRNIPLTILPEEDEYASPPLEGEEFDTEIQNNLETDKRKSGEISEENIIIESGKIVEPLRKKISFVSPASFARLEGRMVALHAQLEAMSIHILPSDEALLEETRKSTNDAEPIRNLLQSLNITKRMTGAEEGIDKLASLLETMAKEYANLKIIIDKLEEELGQNIVKTMMDIKSAAEYSRKIRPRIELFSKASSRDLQQPDCISYEGSSHSRKSDGRKVRINIKPQIYRYNPKSVKKRVVKMSKDKRVKVNKDAMNEDDSFGSEMSRIKSCMKDYRVAEDKETSTFLEDYGTDPTMGQILKENTKIMRNVEFLNAEMNTLADYVDAIILKLDIDEQSPPFMDKVNKANKKLKAKDKIMKRDNAEECKQTAIQLEERVACLEIQFPNLKQKIKRQLAAFCERINSISIRMNDLEENIATIFKNLKVIIKFKGRNEGVYLKKILGLIASNSKKYNKIVQDIDNLKSSLTNMPNTDEKETNVIEDCIQEMENLKKMKADKFEIDEFLASKADCELLKMKVSIDEFELVCNDFARGIEETLTRVAAQEDTMKIIFNELYAVLNRKCDNEVIDQLREEFLTKLDNIRNELFHTPSKKSARLAAGAKEKLSPMNCVSCDREVYMRTSIPPLPALSELPPSTSIKPFIAYQLDQLRKVILRNPDQRSVFVFEEAVNRYRIKAADPEENTMILFYSNAYIFPIRDMSELDSQPRFSRNESCSTPVTYCPETTKSTCQTPQQELNAKENNTQNTNKTFIILVLVPTGNLTIQEFNSSSKSHDKCIEKFQESMNISRSLAEMLFFHTNMSLYAISDMAPAEKNNTNILQDLSIPVYCNGTTKFIGFVKPMLRCAINQNISSSTRKPTTTTISDRLNSDKIVFTKNEPSITSPWGSLGVKTTRMSVDIIQNATTKKHSKTTTTTSWMNTFNILTITNTPTTRFMPSTIKTKVAH